MALSLEQQNALNALPPPDSLERITQFLSDLGTQGSGPLGETGHAAQNFASALGARSFSARQTSGWVAILMDRYQIKMLEIQDFALWFVRRQGIFAEMPVPELAERAPESVLARLPAPAVRTASATAFALAAPSVEADVLLPLSSSAATSDPKAPRRNLRRQSVTSPTESVSADAAVSADTVRETAPPSPKAGDAPRLRRIPRAAASSEPDSPAATEADSPTEDAPPAQSRFKLTPQMITRPAFVTNIGLAGLLTGMSLAPAQAEPLLASPAMNLASPLLSNAGPTLGTPPSQPALPPLGTPAFTPMVTPMTVTAVSAPLPPSLGMPPALPVSTAMPLPAPSPIVHAAPPAPVFAAPSAADAAPTLPALLPLAAPPNAALSMPQTPSPPSAVSVLSAAKAPLTLVGLAAGSAGLWAASRLFEKPVIGTSPVLGQTLSDSENLPSTAPDAALPGGPQMRNTALALPGLAAGSAGLVTASRLLGANEAPNATPNMALPNTALPNAALSPMSLFTSQAAKGVSAANRADGRPNTAAPMAVTPEMGQMTLIAPPLQVASAQAENSGMAASLDWKTLAGGAGPLDEGSLARLKPVLPANAGLLYPALPPGRLGAGAVNLPLSSSLVQSLLQKSYPNTDSGMAVRAANLGSAASGGTPSARPLPAQIVPSKRPMGAGAGVLGHADEQKGGAGALVEAGQGQAKRGGVMDFLGLPVRLAPSLSGGTELARETAVRTAGQGPVQSQQTLRPETFAPLRNRLFPAFHSMTAEPDQAAWRQAAPAFGLRDSKPTTILAPDARVPVQTPTSPRPASIGQPLASSRPLPLIPAPLHGGFSPGAAHITPPLGSSHPGGVGNIISGVSQAIGHSPSGGFGGILSGTSQARPSSGGFGSIPSGINQARQSSGSGLGNIGSGVLQALGHSPIGGVGSIGSGISQALGHSPSGGFGNIVSGFSQARPSSGFGTIPSGINQARQGSGSGFGNIVSGINQARQGSRGGFGGIGSGLSQIIGHSGAGHPAGAGQTGPGKTSTLPRFTAAHSGKPPVHLAGPRTVSPRLLPSQIISYSGGAAPSRTASSRLGSSRVVNFGPVPKSTGNVPAMRFAAPRTSVQSAATAPQMIIQRSETTTAVTPARNEGAKTHARVAAGPQGGAASSEVNALAGEVWSLLKRRLANEAERRGRW